MQCGSHSRPLLGPVLVHLSHAAAEASSIGARIEHVGRPRRTIPMSFSSSIFVHGPFADPCSLVLLPLQPQCALSRTERMPGVALHPVNSCAVAPGAELAQSILIQPLRLGGKAVTIHDKPLTARPEGCLTKDYKFYSARSESSGKRLVTYAATLFHGHVRRRRVTCAVDAPLSLAVR